MQILTNNLSLIILIGFITGVYLIFIYLGISFKNFSNMIMLFLVISIVLCTFSGFYILSGIFSTVPQFIRMEITFFTFLGPLFYFYVKSLIIKPFKIYNYEIFLIVGHLILIALSIPFYFKSNVDKIIYYQCLLKGNFFIDDLFSIIMTNILQWIMILLIFKLIVHNKKSDNSVNQIDSKMTKWITISLISFTVGVISIDITLILLLFNFKYVTIYKIVPVYTCMAIYYLGFNGIKLRDIFLFKNEKTKYYKSKFKMDKSSSYYRKLLEFMNECKPYLEMDLSLQYIANKLNIPRNHLSYIINEYTKLNFYDFINKYRIESAKKLLENFNSEKFNMLYIAYESGFKSKSTFNKVFKKFTNFSPSEYVKYAKKNSS
jgi:AraC-like DNA-binding protein